jgi:hypothetical protein
MIRTYCSKAGGGRKPYPLESMLRIHLLQNGFSISELRGLVGRQALPLKPHRPIHIKIARLCACIIEGAMGAAQGG